jgi:hypothetical protein
MESRASNHEWRGEVVAVTADLGLIKWHSRRRFTGRSREVRVAVRDLSASIETEIQRFGYVTDWRSVLKGIAQLKRALYGAALDDISETGAD